MDILNGNVELGVPNFSDEELAKMLIVPEDIVELCSQTMVSTYGGDEENNFQVVLRQGNILKVAGRTPVYLCTQDMKTLYVTSVEKVQKQYH